MKTDNILSNNATIINTLGYIDARNITVTAHPETETNTATIQIGCTLHRRDVFWISEEIITHKQAGWSVRLS